MAIIIPREYNITYIYDVLSTSIKQRKGLKNSRMQLIIKGGYFGAANKFQKSKYTHKQSSKHSNKHSNIHSSKQSADNGI